MTEEEKQHRIDSFIVVLGIKLKRSRCQIFSRENLKGERFVVLLKIVPNEGGESRNSDFHPSFFRSVGARVLSGVVSSGCRGTSMNRRGIIGEPPFRTNEFIYSLES